MGTKPLHQTIDHVNLWHTEHITAKQLCNHIYNRLTPEQLTQDHPKYIKIPPSYVYHYRAHGSPHAWISDETVLTTPSGKTTIDNYTQSKAPIRKKAITTHPIPHHKSKVGTLNTPLSPQDRSTMTRTPSHTLRIIRNYPPPHKPQWSPPTRSKQKTHYQNAKSLKKLNTLYNHTNDKVGLLEALAELTHKHAGINIVCYCHRNTVRNSRSYGVQPSTPIYTLDWDS
jgi:hypothetical protein